ncbi:MAG TPA: hypothetical protein V6C57_05875 [Coleofasciculaceae cyanobacterium]
MIEIPAEVKEYLSSRDALHRVQVVNHYPNLQQTLSEPQTRTAILTWLTSEEAWEQSMSSLLDSCLAFLQAGATPEESPIVRNFLFHNNPHVRLHAYEFLISLYFPDQNPEALLILLHSMLLDADDLVRTQAISYIERANLVTELKEFLKGWLKAAPSRGWSQTESFELVERFSNN